jgi:hypothetical protein
MRSDRNKRSLRREEEALKGEKKRDKNKISQFSEKKMTLVSGFFV